MAETRGARKRRHEPRVPTSAMEQAQVEASSKDDDDDDDDDLTLVQAEETLSRSKKESRRENQVLRRDTKLGNCPSFI
jgi:hypothetical protein